MMKEQLDVLFVSIRNTILLMIKEKNIDIDCLAFDLGLNKQELLNNFSNRNDDFTFYLQTLSVVENWED